MDNKKLAESAEKTIINNEKIDLMKDIAEFGLDSIIENDTFNSIPIISVISNSIKTTKNIKEKLYINKLATFLKEIDQNTNSAQVIDEIDKIYKRNPNYFGRKICFILDAAKDDEKSSIIGFIFNKLFKGSISYDYAIEFSDIVNSMSLKYLKLYSKKYINGKYVTNSSLLSVLKSNGLINDLDEHGNFVMDANVTLDKIYKLTCEAKILGEILDEYFN